MKRLKLNPEFFYRHLAVCILMLGMGCWFGYDGLVAYPNTPAAELYEKIEMLTASELLELAEDGNVNTFVRRHARKLLDNA